MTMIAKTDRRMRRLAPRLIRRVLATTLAVLMLPFALPNAASANSPVAPDWPDLADVAVHQDNIITRLTWQTMGVEGATHTGFRVRAVEGGFQSQGTRAKSQLKFMLRADVQYAISLRAFYPGEGWSDWGPEFNVTSGRISGAPWSVQLVAGPRSLSAEWVDTGADAYRYRLWSDDGYELSGTRSTTSLAASGIRNGRTYYFSVQAIYGPVRSPWSTPLAVNPNNGLPATIELRDYVIDIPTGPLTMPVLTATTGDTNRIDSLAVYLSSSNEDSRTTYAAFDPAANATSGVGGAWASNPMRFELVDHEVIAEAYDGNKIVASSLQSWILGSLDADHARVPSRIPNFR